MRTLRAPPAPTRGGRAADDDDGVRRQRVGSMDARRRRGVALRGGAGGQPAAGLARRARESVDGVAGLSASNFGERPVLGSSEGRSLLQRADPLRLSSEGSSALRAGH
jgi:hypothetical protein